MGNTSLQRSGLSLRGKHDRNGLKDKEQAKGLLKVNWDWYGAWSGGVFTGGLPAAGLYYLASGSPTGYFDWVPGLPLILLGAIMGSILGGSVRTEWPDSMAFLEKTLQVLRRIFMILAIAFYIALLFSACQSEWSQPPWQGWGPLD